MDNQNSNQNNNNPNNKNPKNNRNNKQGISFIILVTLITTVMVMALFQFQGTGSDNEISYDEFLEMVDDDHNCLCLCSGSLGANPENNVADIVRTYCGRIAFAHIRNVRHYPNGDFTEASHRDCDGDTGILEIVRAYHDCGYTGYVRPDHGRHIWGEQCRPGYGLYDRALGIMYLWGCWDMLERTEGAAADIGR